jgi:hypothetical protein
MTVNEAIRDAFARVATFAADDADERERVTGHPQPAIRYAASLLRILSDSAGDGKWPSLDDAADRLARQQVAVVPLPEPDDRNGNVYRWAIDPGLDVEAYWEDGQAGVDMGMACLSPGLARTRAAALLAAADRAEQLAAEAKAVNP